MASLRAENPAEELNRFPESDAGSHWGYPYCWTEFGTSSLSGKGKGKGTRWAWPSFMSDGIHTDEWCRTNTKPAAVAMQAHSAPLGIDFYIRSRLNATIAALQCGGGGGGGGGSNRNNKNVSAAGGGFPASMEGHGYIGYHGSWNRDVPTGHKVGGLGRLGGSMRLWVYVSMVKIFYEIK